MTALETLVEARDRLVNLRDAATPQPWVAVTAVTALGRGWRSVPKPPLCRPCRGIVAAVSVLLGDGGVLTAIENAIENPRRMMAFLGESVLYDETAVGLARVVLDATDGMKP
jgi:hypothetical protein